MGRETAHVARSSANDGGGAMPEHSDLRLKLSERIAALALRHVTESERNAFLQEEDKRLRADGMAAGLSSDEAASAAERVIAWVRDMIVLAEREGQEQTAEGGRETRAVGKKR